MSTPWSTSVSAIDFPLTARTTSPEGHKVGWGSMVIVLCFVKNFPNILFSNVNNPSTVAQQVIYVNNRWQLM